MRSGIKIFFFLFFLMSWRLPAVQLRLVSQSPALTELVFKLGMGHILVGRSEACNYPDAVGRLPVTGRFNDPVPERVLILKPTHFMADGLVHPAAAECLRRAGTKVLIRPCRNLAEYLAWVELLGREFGCPEAAARETRRIQAFQVECHRLNRQKKASPPKVLWVIWDAPLIVAGEGSLPAEILRLAGAVNAAGRVKQAYFKASREWLLLHPPEVVVWSVSGRPAPTLRHPFWSQFKAVQRGAVITELNPDILLRPGPRLPEGVQALRLALEKMP